MWVPSGLDAQVMPIGREKTWHSGPGKFLFDQEQNRMQGPTCHHPAYGPVFVLGVENTIIEESEFNQEHRQLIMSVRPRVRSRKRWGACRRRAPSYNRGRRRR